MVPTAARSFTESFHGWFSVPIFLALIAWCMRGGKRNSFDKWLTCFAMLAFVLPVIAQYSLQKYYVYAHRMPLLPNCMRGQKFAYLILYIYIAWLLAELFRRFVFRDKCILIFVTAVIVTIMPPFINNRRNPWGQWDYNAAQLKTLLDGQKIESAGWHRRVINVANWARRKTPVDSLFLFVHPDMSPFRIYAFRSLVTSLGCGDMTTVNGAELILDWAKYQRDIDRILAKADISRLIKLAGQSKADYIIVPQNFPQITKWSTVMQDRFWTVYKKAG